MANKSEQPRRTRGSASIQQNCSSGGGCRTQNDDGVEKEKTPAGNLLLAQYPWRTLPLAIAAQTVWRDHGERIHEQKLRERLGGLTIPFTSDSLSRNMHVVLNKDVMPEAHGLPDSTTPGRPRRTAARGSL